MNKEATSGEDRDQLVQVKYHDGEGKKVAYFHTEDVEQAKERVQSRGYEIIDCRGYSRGKGTTESKGSVANDTVMLWMVITFIILMVTGIPGAWFLADDSSEVQEWKQSAEIRATRISGLKEALQSQGSALEKEKKRRIRAIAEKEALEEEYQERVVHLEEELARQQQENLAMVAKYTIQLERKIEERKAEAEKTAENEVLVASRQLHTQWLQIYEDLAPLQEDRQLARYHRKCMDRILELDTRGADRGLSRAITKIGSVHARYAALEEEYQQALENIENGVAVAAEAGAMLGDAANRGEDYYTRQRGAVAGKLLMGMLGAAIGEEERKELRSNYQREMRALYNEWLKAHENLEENRKRVFKK